MQTKERNLDTVLEASSLPHKHLCPRQVLGARIGLAGGEALGLELPRSDKSLLVIAETDGCFLSGLQAATGCAPNRRTLRVEDYGKIAATFVQVETGEAVRIAPQLDVREKAFKYAPGIKKRYYAMLAGYQVMPENELLRLKPVTLTPPVQTLISRAGVRVSCERCGEEIINERERNLDNETLCRSCAGDSYYVGL